MRHTAVRRTVLALAAVLVSSACLFVWLVGPRQVEVPAVEPAPSGSPRSAAPASPDGAALFRSYCGSCHSTSSLKLAQPRVDLEVFLRTHGSASDADDVVILDFLAGQR